MKDDEAGLLETFRSVEAQSFSDYEFLIVTPNGQNYRYRELHKSSLPVKVFEDAGVGIYKAMNLGLFHAQGEYIIFLNAGDVLVDSRQALERAIDEIRCRGLLWLAFSYRIRKNTKTKTFIKAGAVRTVFLALGLRRVIHQALVMRTDWLRRLGGFDTSYEIAGDFALILSAKLEQPLVFSPHLLSEFRTGGISSRNPDRVLAEMARAQRENLPTSIGWRSGLAVWRMSWQTRLMVARFRRALRGSPCVLE